MSADAVWEVLRWLDTGPDWRWLLLRLFEKHDLRRPLSRVPVSELFDRGEDAFALVRHGDKDAPSRERLSRLAAAAGHLSAFRRHAIRTQANLRRDLIVASRNGHIELVCQIRDWGVVDFIWGASAAACGGHLELVRQFAAWGDGGAEWFLAGIRGNTSPEETGQGLREWGNRSGSALRYEAIKTGDLDSLRVVRLWADTSVEDDDRDLCSAARHGQLAVLRQLQAWGARGYDAARIVAILNGHYEVAAQLRVWKTEA